MFKHLLLYSFAMAFSCIVLARKAARLRRAGAQYPGVSGGSIGLWIIVPLAVAFLLNFLLP